MEASLDPETMSGATTITPKDVANTIQELNISFDEQLRMAIEIGQRVIAHGKVGASDISMIPEVQRLMGLPQRVLDVTRAPFQPSAISLSTTANVPRIQRERDSVPKEPTQTGWTLAEGGFEGEGASPVAGPSSQASQTTTSKQPYQSIPDPFRVRRAFGNVFTKTREEIERELTVSRSEPTLEFRMEAENEAQLKFDAQPYEPEAQSHELEANGSEAGGGLGTVGQPDSQQNSSLQQCDKVEWPDVVNTGVGGIKEPIYTDVRENVNHSDVHSAPNTSVVQKWPWEERQGRYNRSWILNIPDDYAPQSPNAQRQYHAADFESFESDPAPKSVDPTASTARYLVEEHQDNVKRRASIHPYTTSAGPPENFVVHGTAAWQGQASQHPGRNDDKWYFDTRNERRRTSQNPRRGRGGYLNWGNTLASDYTHRRQHYHRGKDSTMNRNKGQEATNQARDSFNSIMYSNGESRQISTTAGEQLSDSNINLQHTAGTATLSEYPADATLVEDDTFSKCSKHEPVVRLVVLPWAPTTSNPREILPDFSSTARFGRNYHQAMSLRFANPKVDLPVPSVPGPNWMFSQTKNTLEIE